MKYNFLRITWNTISIRYGKDCLLGHFSSVDVFYGHFPIQSHCKSSTLIFCRNKNEKGKEDRFLRPHFNPLGPWKKKKRKEKKKTRPNRRAAEVFFQLSLRRGERNRKCAPKIQKKNNKTNENLFLFRFLFFFFFAVFFFFPIFFSVDDTAVFRRPKKKRIENSHFLYRCTAKESITFFCFI